MKVNPWWKLSNRVTTASIEINAIIHDPPNEEIAELAEKVRDALVELQDKVLDVVVGDVFEEAIEEAASADPEILKEAFRKRGLLSETDQDQDQ